MTQPEHIVFGIAMANTGDAGWAVTVGIPVKFDIAHGKSVPEVGGAKCIGAYGRKGVPPAPKCLVHLSKIL